MPTSDSSRIPDTTMDADLEAIRKRMENGYRLNWGNYNVYPYFVDIAALLSRLEARERELLVVTRERDAAVEAQVQGGLEALRVTNRLSLCESANTEMTESIYREVEAWYDGASASQAMASISAILDAARVSRTPTTETA